MTNEELERQAAQLLAEVEGGIVDTVETNSEVTTISEEESSVSPVIQSAEQTLEEAAELLASSQQGDVDYEEVSDDAEMSDEELELIAAELEEEREKERIKLEELLNTCPIAAQVRESLEAIWPGNWDIQIQDNSYYMIIVRFPEVTVKNGKKMETNIKDLFVRLPFNTDWTSHSRMEGRVLTFDYAHFHSSYSHSHLNRNQGTSWNRFCLGSSELSAISTEWQMYDHEFDIMEFELWMYQIDAYVQWESLQGGPYIRMETISVTGERHHLGSMQLSQGFQAFVKVCNRHKLTMPIKFDKSTNKFKVTQSDIDEFMEDNIDKFKYDAMTLNNRLERSEYWTKYDGYAHIFGNPDYDHIERTICLANVEAKEGDYSVEFKGETIVRKVLPYEVPDDSNLTEVAHPDLTSYISNQLTFITNNYFIKKYGK